jgi:hypothetical protein
MITVDENNCVDVDGNKVSIETLISSHKFRQDEKSRMREFAIILFAQNMVGKGNGADWVAKEAIKQADAIIKYL